ncbi:hypothetical protein HKX48_000843, partial [Thoreauomyces humboldtii]
MTSQAPSTTSWKAVDESVRHVQLFDALRSNDPKAIAVAVRLLPAQEGGSAAAPAYGSPLHLTISLSPTPVTESLIATFPDLAQTWVNAATPRDGETPLHLAAKRGRADIVELLFRIPGIQDTLRDARGRTPEEAAGSERLAQIIADHKAEFALNISRKVKQHLVSDEPQRVIDIFSKDPRAGAYLSIGWIGINDPIDPDTEQSILHFAAKADNMALVDWALSNGADPGVKDKKGRKPIDLCPKNISKTKNRLKTAIPQAPITSGSLLQATSATLGAASLAAHPSAHLSHRGILMKWINYASGYKPRFFVLERGSLSYYKTATDYPLACRGSISTMIANVVLPDSNDKSRFDVIGRGSVKYSLKARSPADAKKWVWVLLEAKKMTVDASRVGVSPSRSNPGVGEPGGDWELEEDAEIEKADAEEEAQMNANVEGVSADSLPQGQPGQASAHRDGAGQAAPFEKSEDDIGMLMNMLHVQMDVQQRVVETLVAVLGSSPPPTAAPDTTATSSASQGAFSTYPALLRSSSEGVFQTVNRLVQRCQTQERVWAKRWRKERDNRRRWEEVVQKVLNDDAMTHRREEGGDDPNAPHPDTSIFTTDGHTDVDHDEFEEAEDEEEEEDDEADDDDVFYDAEEAGPAGGTIGRAGLNNRRSTLGRATPTPPPPVRTQTSASIVVSAGATGLVPTADLKSSTKGYPTPGTERTSIPLDLSKPKPTLAVWSFLKSAIGKDLSKITLPVFFNEPLSMLQRMGEDAEYIELLSVASAVGRGCEPGSAPISSAGATAAKDLGLEPEMLVGLRDEEASLTRLMFVAAYAMSNYSSTIGRIQKPFNPILGETFECVREDKGFRYLSEQPISACHCESPDYTFWTEVNVKSKFWGKSLEIHPLGVCHVRLPIYKPGSPEVVETEHYTWKKVTTSVNNVIVGKLWMDHYGDMVVRNWRTGEECVVTFKPKQSGGWFSSRSKPSSDQQEDLGGGEIAGTVRNKEGQVRWELQGRWDGRVSAVPVSNGTGTGGGSSSSKSTLPSTLPLWKRSPLPDNAAQNFSFTRFAMTLNELPTELRSVLPLTDSRLRPDQRAMEVGDWDDANTLKERLELLQRDRRRNLTDVYDRTGRPSGPDPRGIDVGEKWWVPRWFVREVDPDSGEEHWRFDDAYWRHRDAAAAGAAGEETGERDQQGKQGGWPEYVLDVFG